MKTREAGTTRGGAQAPNGRQRVVSVIVLCLAVALVAASGSSAQDPAPLAGTPAPTTEAQWEAELEAWQAARAPAPLAQRQDSQSAYEDLSRDQALELTDESFSDYLNSLDEPLLASAGDEIESYVSDNVAVVEPAGPEPRQLIVSSLPLRVEDESGERAAVATELEPGEEGYEPANVGTELRIPTDLAEGIEIGSDGVVLGVPEPERASAPRLIADDSAVFYAEIATDVDLVVAPITGGFRFAVMLRSARSPERIVLPLELGGAASLEVTGDFGAARIDVAGPDDILISPPLALDADGRSIETHLEASGENLVLVARHSAGTPHFPILVDPEVVNGQVVSDDSFEGGPDDYAARGWSYFEGPIGGTTNPAAYPYTGYWAELFGPGTNSGGLFLTAPQNTSYAANLIARWSIEVPHLAGGTSAYYNYAKFISPWLYVQGGQAPGPPGYGTYPRPMLEYGLKPAAANGGTWWARNLYYGTWGSIVGPPGGETWFGPTNDPSVKQVSFGLHSTATTATPPAGQSRSAYFGGLRTYIADGEAPQTTAGAVSGAPSGWTDAATQLTGSLTAIDGGLGVQELQLLAGFSGSALQELVADPTRLVGTAPNQHTCEGWNDYEYCPQTHTDLSLAFSTSQLPEGVSTIYGRASDVVGKLSALRGLGEIRVDRSGPTISAPAGSLIDSASHIASTGEYEITVSASDEGPAGSTGDARLRSGTKQLELLVDGEPMFSETNACGGTGGACSANMQASWTFDPEELDDGPHTVQIRAKDALDHSSALTVPIDVFTDTTDPILNATLTAPDSSGVRSVVASASDGTPFGQPGSNGSGVVRTDVFVDGDPVEPAFRQDCPGGGCQMPERSFRLPAGTNPSTESVAIFTHDAAGNANYKELGKATAPKYFGYNDQFFATMTAAERTTIVERSIAGGGNILRIGVNWCDMQRIEAPIDWAYDGSSQSKLGIKNIRAFFEIVQGVNSENTPEGDPPLIKVIPVLYGSPGWARPNKLMINGKTGGDSEYANDPENAEVCAGTGRLQSGDRAPERTQGLYPPDTGHLPQWANFVRSFVDRFGPGADPDYGVIALETWNEPNLRFFWGNFSQVNQDTVKWEGAQPGFLAQLFDAASDALTATQRDSLALLAGGLSPAGEDPEQVLHDFLDASARKPTIDGFSIHLYANMTSSISLAVDKTIKDYEDIVSTAREFDAVSDERTWITEIGFPANNEPPADEEEKPDLPKRTDVAYQRKKLDLAFKRFAIRRARVQAFLVHRLYDCIPGQCFPDDLDVRGAFGLWADAGAPSGGDSRPAYCLLRDKAQTGVSGLFPGEDRC